MPHTIVELFIKIRTSGMVLLLVKPLRHFKHVHEGKSKWFKYCKPEFYDVFFMTWNRNISFWTCNISLLWIFIFSTTYLVEKLLFYALYQIKTSPPSTLYMNKLISITPKYFMSASQSCKKLPRKCAKTCHKSKKPRNTAVATYFAN